MAGMGKSLVSFATKANGGNPHFVLKCGRVRTAGLPAQPILPQSGFAFLLFNNSENEGNFKKEALSNDPHLAQSGWFIGV